MLSGIGNIIACPRLLLPTPIIPFVVIATRKEDRLRVSPSTDTLQILGAQSR